MVIVRPSCWLGRLRESHDDHHHPVNAGPLLHHVMGLPRLCRDGPGTRYRGWCRRGRLSGGSGRRQRGQRGVGASGVGVNGCRSWRTNRVAPEARRWLSLGVGRRARVATLIGNHPDRTAHFQPSSTQFHLGLRTTAGRAPQRQAARWRVPLPCHRNPNVSAPPHRVQFRADEHE
jgi:hypothetical protein